MNSHASNKSLVRQAIAQGKFPKSLYKYRGTGENTLAIFESMKLWFPKPSSFNDPFDCNLSEVSGHTPEEAVRFRNHILEGRPNRDYLSSFPVSTAELEAIMTAARARVIDHMGVFCLSRTFDNILMWSHYAEEHKGLVLEFDIEEDYDFFTTPINVVYTVEYEPINHFLDPHDAVTRLISTKSKAWEYEGEVRIMKPHTAGLVSFKPSALKRVIFGCRSDQVFVDKVVALCSKGPLRHVEFGRLSTVSEKFALQLAQL